MFPALASDAAPSQFTQSASPIPVPPAVAFLDDYEPGGAPPGNTTDGCGTFTTSGSGWTYASASPGSLGYQGDYHYHAVPMDQNDPSLKDSATWKITVLADGWYSIQATWPTGTGLQLAGATYQVATALSGPVTMLPMSQTNPGNGVTDANGITWWSLTAPTQLKATDVVTVTISIPQNVTTSGLYVIADSVRIAQNEVKMKSLERSAVGTNDNSDGADVTAHVSITVNLAQ